MAMMPSELEPLEVAVLEWLLAGDHPVLVALRAQLARATVTQRELSGAGFFTHFVVANDAIPVAVRTLRFGDVWAKVAGLRYGADFVLFVDDGRLTMLEGVSFGEPWPETITEFAVTYVDPARPDLATKLG
jgi:hypothetical protein